MSKSNIVRGTMMLTGANYISKVLGVLYVIPFQALVGSVGGALYSYAYNPYQIFISLSTLGIPLAMSKFVAKYDALEDYRTKEAMFRTGLAFMTIMGVVSFLIMFLSAEWLANLFLPSDHFENTVDDAAFVIRMVSFSLLIIPPMSLVRGYFQGHGSMGPSAISIVCEQVVRILFLLIAGYIVLQVLDGTIKLAVGFAAFAAFVGAVASSVVLGGFYKKRRPYIEKELETSKSNVPTISTKEMYRELLAYAGPFILVGIATPLYQLVDQMTFNRAMGSIDLAHISESVLSVILVYGHKIVIIPVTIATALSLALLPAMTRAFTEKNKLQYNSYINQALLMITTLVLPASVGLAILGTEAYGTLYNAQEAHDFAGEIMMYYAPTALFFALFTVSASMLQGINEQNFAVISLGVGLLIKIVCNVPFIQMFEGKGAVIATSLAVLAASFMNLLRLYLKTRFDLRRLLKVTSLIVILTAVMAIVVLITKWLIGIPFGDEPSKMKYITQLIGSVSVGAYAYLWMAYHMSLLERLFGSRVRRFSKIFFSKGD